MTDTHDCVTKHMATCEYMVITKEYMVLIKQYMGIINEYMCIVNEYTGSLNIWVLSSDTRVLSSIYGYYNIEYIVIIIWLLYYYNMYGYCVMNEYLSIVMVCNEYIVVGIHYS